MPINDFAPCEYCGTQTDFVTEVSPLGDEPGHRVYFCDSCKRSTWVARKFAPKPPPQENQPGQLQQQQPQPKKDELKD